MKNLTTLSLLTLAGALASCSPKLPSDGLFALFSTDKGDIWVELYYQRAPLTVTNFAGLASGTLKNSVRKPGRPFFDGLTFHRVVPKFVIQGGDPQGNGTGGPGYSFPDEFNPALVFDSAGILAMANSGLNTNGSQFFITLEPTPWLNGKHSIFGKVVRGFDVVQKIKQNDKIKKVRIYAQGEAAKNFRYTQARFDELSASVRKGEIERMKKEQEENSRKAATLLKNPQKDEDSGILYEITQKGTGEKPKPGDRVEVHYTGKFLDGGVFDSSVRRNAPFHFTVGKGQVIPGWDKSVLDMKVGEKRTIVLPPEQAYGSRGAGGVIPPNAWLVFDVELLKIDN